MISPEQVPHGVDGYLAAVILIIIGLGITSFLLLVNKFIGNKPTESYPIKYDIYECGVKYEGDGRQQFSVRYYLIGIIFLVFDVEIIFMYPWSLIYKHNIGNGPFILLQMAFFMILLVLGYLYLRSRKALSWD